MHQVTVSYDPLVLLLIPLPLVVEQLHYVSNGLESEGKEYDTYHEEAIDCHNRVINVEGAVAEDDEVRPEHPTLNFLVRDAPPIHRSGQFTGSQDNGLKHVDQGDYSQNCGQIFHNQAN